MNLQSKKRLKITKTQSASVVNMTESQTSRPSFVVAEQGWICQPRSLIDVKLRPSTIYQRKGTLCNVQGDAKYFNVAWKNKSTKLLSFLCFLFHSNKGCQSWGEVEVLAPPAIVEGG